MKKNKGFTLIELLVVIAIIGILSSIVLVSVNSARNKAKDAAIKGSLEQARVAAELYYDGTGSGAYTGFCTSTDGVRIATAVAAQSTDAAWVCNDVAGAYCASIKLNGGNYYCVDAAGKVGSATCAAAGTACP